eukprot:XP_002258708.1 KIR protein [Plasmodium knowlesi strain H]
MNSGDPLDQLLSRKLYNKFKESTCYTTYGTSYTEEQRQLQQNQKVAEYTDKIMKAWCYVLRMQEYGLKEYHGDRCTFLYYYIGGLLPVDLSKGLLMIRMNQIENALRGTGRSNNCDNKYPRTTTNKSIFDQRKILFDFKYDHSKMQQQLTSSEFQCTDAYKSHLEAITRAYEAVSADCKGENGKYEYCKTFAKNYGDYFDNGTLKLKCPSVVVKLATPKKPSAGDDFDLGDAVVDGGDHAQNEEKKAEGAQNQGKKTESSSVQSTESSSNIAPGAVAGTLFTVGLPALAYFIYKYKPHLFFGGNNYSARRNKRPTLRRELNIPYSDHNNDNSTIGGSDSMTEFSIPYTRSSFR